MPGDPYESSSDGDDDLVRQLARAIAAARRRRGYRLGLFAIAVTALATCGILSLLLMAG